MTHPHEVEDVLAHFGVKGMKWGVRKKEISVFNPDLSEKGVTMRSDGSIDLKPGAKIQRLVRSNDRSRPMKDVTYASINKYDNARYIKSIGGKGIFGGGRDTILSIEVTKPIKAPSYSDAVKMHSDLVLNNAEFRKRNVTLLGEPISDGDYARIKKDPSGSDARASYEMTNVLLTTTAEGNPNASYVQKTFRDKLASNGYNAVRDENDYGGKISKAPIIIFNPESSLKVVSSEKITDELRKANKEQLKRYKQNGDDWIESKLYR